jgi:hypothetical protein
LVDWSLVTGNTMPPRDPDDDDGDEEEDDEPQSLENPTNRAKDLTGLCYALSGIGLRGP